MITNLKWEEYDDGEYQSRGSNSKGLLIYTIGR